MGVEFIWLKVGGCYVRIRSYRISPSVLPRLTWVAGQISLEENVIINNTARGGGVVVVGGAGDIQTIGAATMIAKEDFCR
jgi:hypothetical protein